MIHRLYQRWLARRWERREHAWHQLALSATRPRARIYDLRSRRAHDHAQACREQARR